jgi:cytosine deaminase
MRLSDYGLEIGKSADFVVLDCTDRATAIAELVQPLWGFKRGRITFSRQPATLHRPN